MSRSPLTGDPVCLGYNLATIPLNAARHLSLTSPSYSKFTVYRRLPALRTIVDTFTIGRGRLPIWAFSAFLTLENWHHRSYQSSSSF